ncbi:MAG: putative ATPase/GAF domain-containing protein, partial [bacterium]
MERGSMILIPGFSILKQVYDGRHSFVYRAKRKADNKLVVLKTLRKEYPTPEEVARFKREYEITRKINAEGVIQVQELLNYQNSLVIVLEDFAGESLEKIVALKKLELEDFFRIAIRITDILGRIHQQQIIHKDINPSNIIWNTKTDEIKIIDFGLSSEFACDSKNLEGTLAYIAPEQTGRTNRKVDYRSDLYSLGVTFYYLLTGEVPFKSIDSMELIHEHIAKVPVPPHKINSKIPKAVSSIVLKLMSKMAEERYQSSLGLRTDLERCQEQFSQSGKIEDIHLGYKDISNRFQFPRKIYGRKTEFESLKSAYQRAADGSTELLLIAGSAGLGKSALVSKLRKPVIQQHGYFLVGKFDQFRKNIPYDSLTQVFQELIRQILNNGSAKQIAVWKEKLLNVLGQNGQVIVDVIPDVELIIGAQPPIPDLSPVEQKNRFNVVFQKFVRTLATKEHPLVIFLDNLQWAESSALHLIQLFMTDPQSKYVLLIGAYQDAATDANHPLLLAVDQIRRSGAKINSILLQPLTLAEVNKLIAEALQCDLKRSSPLAELCYERTHGNPHFLSQFLYSLYREHALIFDDKKGYWSWDIQKIEAQDVTKNVASLMSKKIKTLSPIEQEIISLAACIGGEFELNLLSSICEKSPHEVITILRHIIREGLIAFIGDGYKVLQDERKIKHIEYKKLVCKFLHDEVRKSAYSEMNDAQRVKTHLKIGNLLLNELNLQEREEKIFEITNHLNEGKSLLKTNQEFEDLAKLNLQAGKRAKSSTAYETALNYFSEGVELIKKRGWKKHYDLMLELTFENAEISCLNQDFERMEVFCKDALKKGKTLLDKVKIYEVRIQACLTQHKLNDAIKTALPILKMLGTRLPENPGKWNVFIGIMETRLTLTKKKFVDLTKLPIMKNPDKLATMRILSKISSAAYMGCPRLYPLIIFKLVQLSLKYGNAPESTTGYASFGLLSCGILDDIDNGFHFGQLSIRGLEKFHGRKYASKVLLIVNGCVRHWKMHLRETLDPLLEGYQAGLDIGDSDYASYNAHMHFLHAFIVGTELNELSKEMNSFNKNLQNIKQNTYLNFHQIWLQTVKNLINPTLQPWILTSPDYDEGIMLEKHTQANDRTALHNFYASKRYLHYLFYDYSQAVENSRMAKKYLDGVTAMIHVPLYSFYDSLSYLGLLPELQKFEYKTVLKRIANNQERLKKWADHAPMNFLNKFMLVEAEQAGFLKKDEAAMYYYDKSIELSKKYGYLNDEALGNELAAKFYLDRKKEKIAKTYMQEAHYRYLRWGAKTKVAHLEKNYPHLLTSPQPETYFHRATAGTHHSQSNEENTASLDLTTVMKASQAISGEIVLQTLLEKMMQIVMENAGAQRAVLLLEKQGQLFIEAEGFAHQKIQLHESFSLENHREKAEKMLPISIIVFVARTKENVVLENASADSRFNDTYILNHNSQSILCIPILHQGHLLGVLYLENNLNTGVFSSSHLNLLQLIAAQTGISIQNAQLFGNLESLVKDRTLELSKALEDLQRTQKQLVESEKMASLGGLVAGVAHEINTPLGVSVTAATHQKKMVNEFTNDFNAGKSLSKKRFIEFINTVDESSDILVSNLNRAGDLIQSFKKVAVHQSTENRLNFNIKQYLEDILRSLKPQLRKVNHKVTINCSNDLMFDSYPGKFSQIVTNLIFNSIRHAYEAEESGTLIFDVTELDEQLQIIYSDDGKGIPVEILHKVFEP